MFPNIIHLYFYPIVFSLFILTIILFSCRNEQRKSEHASLRVSVDTVQTYPFTDTTTVNFVNSDTLYKYFDTLKINGVVYFFYQGDLLLEEKEFKRFLLQELLQLTMHKYQKIHKEEQKLVITYDPIKEDTIKWKNFPIRFSIKKSSFKKIPGGYEIIKSNFKKAIADWVGVSKVRFDYIEAADVATEISSYRLDFYVEYIEPTSRLPHIAIAFYPNDPENMRVLRVLPSYWKSDKDKIGIFRHEIGHILGFRHEHAAYINLAPLECRQYFPEDPLPSKPVTITYDTLSVMHYFCGNAGTKEMKFSKNDSLGIIAVYGKN
jgi:hypothetical protein